MTTLPLPFRTDCIHNSKSSDDRAASHQQYELFDRDEESLVIDAMRRIRETPSPDQMMAWVTHPSERVALEFVEQLVPKIPALSLVRYDIEVALYRRAILDAGDAVWTPLIDAMAVRSYGPSGPSPKLEDVPFERYPDRVRGLIPWIAEERDPSRLRLLLRFRYKPIRHFILRYARSLDESLVRDLVGESLELTESLAANPELKESWVAAAYEVAIPRIRAKEPLGPAVSRGLIKLANALGRVPGGYLDEISEMTKSLGSERHTAFKLFMALPGVDVQRLESVYLETGRLLNAEGVTEFLAHPAATEDFRRLVLKKCSAPGSVAAGIVSNRKADSSLLLLALEHLQPSRDTLLDVLQHPASDLRVWRKVAEMSGDSRVRRWLVSHPDACRDPVIRTHLAASRDAAVLMPLLRDPGDGTALDQIFKAAAKLDPHVALRALLEAPEGSPCIDASLLGPFLTSPHREIREAAFLVLARVGRIESRSPESNRSRARVRG